jgi:hypothetical protein
MANLPEGDMKLTIEQLQDEDDEQLENYTRMLCDELKQLPEVEDASLVTKKEKIPEGARAGEIVTLGEIALTFITSGAAVATLKFLGGWIRDRKRKIKIETKNGKVETDNLSEKELNKVIDLLKDKNA